MCKTKKELVRIRKHLHEDMRGYVKSYNEDKDEVKRINSILRRKR